MTIESSGISAPDSWFSGLGHGVATGTPVVEIAGTLSYTGRDAVPMSSAHPPRRFLRMKVILP